MSGDSSEQQGAEKITALVALTAKLRIIAASNQLERAPEIKQQINDVVAELERIYSVDESGDFDSLSDIDAHSNVQVNAKSVGEAFARPGRRNTNVENAKNNGKHTQKQQARVLYDAEPGTRPLSKAARANLKPRFLELGIVDSTARRWLDEFDGPSRR